MLKKFIEKNTKNWMIQKTNKNIRNLSEEDILCILKIIKEITQRELMGKQNLDICMPHWIVQKEQGMLPMGICLKDFHDIICCFLLDAIEGEKSNCSDKYQNIKADPMFLRNCHDIFSVKS